MTASDENRFESASAEHATEEGGANNPLLALVPQLLEIYRNLFAAKRDIVHTELKIALKSLLAIILCAFGFLAVTLSLWLGLNALIIHQLWSYYPDIWLNLVIVVIFNLCAAALLIRTISSLAKSLSFSETASVFGLNSL